MNQRQPREHNEKHLRFIRGLPCVVCRNDIQTEAAHVRFSCADVGKINPGVGAKPHDKWTVPLCGEHHRMQHAWNEPAFWRAAGKDPIRIAQDLWAHSGDQEMGERIVRGVQLLAD
jgi:hypothetical protein